MSGTYSIKEWGDNDDLTGLVVTITFESGPLSGIEVTDEVGYDDFTEDLREMWLTT